MIDLYQDQIELKTAIRQALIEGHKRIMVMASTGFGKTRVAASICESALEKGKKVLFITDLKTLVNQSYDSFADLGLNSSVIMGDDGRYAPWKNLHICSVQTLARRKVPDADLILVDEAHTLYKTVIKIMVEWPLVPVLGLSATPFSRGLGKYYTKLVKGPSTAELIKNNRLVEPVCYGPETVDTSDLKMKGNDVDEKQQAEKFRKNAITADILKTYQELGEGRKFIMFPVNCAHSKDLVNAFNYAGIKCMHIDAYTSSEDRDKAYRMLETGELQGLSSVGVLAKGFDETSVSCVILAYITKSLMKYIQTVGRGLRAHEGKTDCIILDHGGNVARMGYPDDPLPDYLCDGEKTEAARQNEREEEKQEKEELPRRCPDCDYLVKPKIFTCPCCGHLFSKKSAVHTKEGKLTKIKRTPAEMRNKTVSKEIKQAFYSAALSYCRAKGFKDGWAAMKYREYFSVWPNKMAKISGGYCAEFDNFMKYNRIKWAKRNTG